MYLKEKDCRRYYCLQAGGGNTDAYFQGVRYQRGGGFFQNIFRSNAPLMMKAGKYFGKRLLNVGSNVVSDITSGNSLKDSARSRFREEAENIKDDLFQKLQQRGEGIKKKRRKKSMQSSSKRGRANNKRKKGKKKTSSKRRKTSSYNYRDIFS